MPQFPVLHNLSVLLPPMGYHVGRGFTPFGCVTNHHRQSLGLSRTSRITRIAIFIQRARPDAGQQRCGVKPLQTRDPLQLFSPEHLFCRGERFPKGILVCWRTNQLRHPHPFRPDIGVFDYGFVHLVPNQLRHPHPFRPNMNVYVQATDKCSKPTQASPSISTNSVSRSVFHLSAFQTNSGIPIHFD